MNRHLSLAIRLLVAIAAAGTFAYTMAGTLAPLGKVAAALSAVGTP
jgi:hypothetical protein